MTKTADNTWEIAIYNKADAAAGANSFPYSSAALATGTLNFDPTNGKLTAASLSVAVVHHSGRVRPSTSTSAAWSSSPPTTASSTPTVNGNAPSAVDRIEIDDGRNALYDLRERRARRHLQDPARRCRRAPTISRRCPATSIMPSSESGAVQVGFSTTGGMGSIVSGALEASTVDLASELTAMIESQRGYTANSKVFQTGSELLDVLVNLKR